MMHIILISNFCFNTYNIKAPLSLSFCGRIEDSRHSPLQKKACLHHKILGLFPVTRSHGTWPHQDGFFSLSLGLAFAKPAAFVCLPLSLPVALCSASRLFLSRLSPHLRAQDSAWRLDAPNLFLHLFVSGTQSLGPASARRLSPTVSRLVAFGQGPGRLELGWGAEPQPSPHSELGFVSPAPAPRPARPPAGSP